MFYISAINLVECILVELRGHGRTKDRTKLDTLIVLSDAVQCSAVQCSVTGRQAGRLIDRSAVLCCAMI